MDVEIIRRAVASERYEISQHAERERRHDGLTLADLENAIRTGEIIEAYPDDIITVYVPDPARWESDWKTRKRGQGQ
ncbi:MAG: DUF4258 domain-containing protein [Desulfotomaculales bacterium]